FVLPGMGSLEGTDAVSALPEIPPGANPSRGIPRLEGGGMKKAAASVSERPARSGETASSGDLLVRAFTELRDELVSTLWFVLGNRDDAQDVAQEAFLKCWRTRDGLAAVQDLRAWIFRVGLNAAKDLQRSAWRRRVKPLLGAEIMLT